MKRTLLFAATLLPALPGWTQVPTISTISPARNALAVARTAPVQVTLSQPVGASSGALRVFSALRGGRLAGTSTTSGNALTFAPTQAFQPGEVVSVTVPTTVQSSAGTPLATPQVFQFTGAATGGTATFSNGGIIPTYSASQRTALGDVDGDGDLDLVVMESSLGNTLGVRLNDGTGWYTAGPGFTVSYAPTDLDLADLDGDGDLDLLISTNGVQLLVRLNDGRGEFRAGYSVALEAYETVAADLDGDGDLDLAATTSSGDLRVAMNGGTGSFGTATVVAVGAASNALAVGDMDGDGDLDLLTYDAFSYAVAIRLNNGNGMFNASQSVPVSGNVYIGRVQGLEVGDIDADGDLDVAVITSASSNVTICRNNGASGFGGNAVVAVGFRPLDIALADLDGDGDLDLAVANGQDATLDIRLNNGTGAFAGGATLPIAPDMQQVNVGDVDGDGDLDLLLATRVSIQELLNIDSPVPPPAPTVVALAPSRNLRTASRTGNVAVTFGQPLSNTAATRQGLTVSSNQRGGRLVGQTTVSGSTITFDPTLDFMPGEHLAVSLSRAVRGSNAALARPHVYQFDAAVGGGTGVFGGGGSLPDVQASALAVDFDNDGDLDLVNDTRVSINNGNGTFAASRSFAANSFTINKTAMADLDGDGDLDLVSSSTNNYSSGSNGVGLLCSSLNNGNGTFAPLKSISLGTFTAGLAVGDIDGDGDLDAALGYEYTKLGVARNTGNGTFGSAISLEAGIRSTQVFLADMDNDGDLDLVATNGTVIVISHNDGYGVFDTPTTVVTSNVGVLAIADADADGDLDLLAADLQEFNVRLNNGNGTFGSRTALSLVSNGGVLTFQNLLVGDVDGDGDADAVVARAGVGNGGSYSAVMSVCLNSGAGVFGRGSDLVLGTNVIWPAPALLADLDGDGDLDLLATQWYLSGSTLLRFNQGTPTSSRASASTGAQLAVYPNPARESFTVQLRGATVQSAMPLELLNSFGQVVAQTVLHPASQAAEVVLPIGQLAPGLYLVRLTTSTGVLAKQVVVY